MSRFLGQRISECRLDLSKNLAAFHDGLKHDRKDLLDDAFATIRSYDALASDLYRLRAFLPPSDPLRVQTEDVVAAASQELIGFQKEKREGASYSSLIARYREIWRENFSLFLFTTMLFLASVFVGWHIATSEPDFASVFISQPMMENIAEKKPWFESIQAFPPLHGLLIAWNNIKVGITCFTLAALLGIGGVLILCYNGLLFGAIMGFCYTHAFDDALSTFVIGHGILELTLIVATAFAGFLFGRVFYMRPYRLFGRRMVLAVREAGCVLFGILPWFVLAASIEVFISPWPEIRLSSKLQIGILAAALFWLWTFAPFRKLRRGSDHIESELRSNV